MSLGDQDAELRVPRIDILGSPVSAVNMSSACALVVKALDAGRKGYVCVTGVHGLMEAYEKEEFRRILEGAFLVTPDGMPLSWLGWWRGVKGMDRVYGPDLMLALCGLSVEKGYRHFLYGGAPGVAESLKAALEEKVPGLQIVGVWCPPFRPLSEEEEEELAVLVRAVKPDVMWVGLSTPKQERFMAQYLHRLDVTLMFGVGAAFDFHSGRVSQAPYWVQRSGLEWLYRTIQEPRRLLRRYARNNVLFLWRLWKNWFFGGRMKPTEGG